MFGQLPPKKEAAPIGTASLLCRYFRNAVLPAEKELYAEIFKQRTYRCAECGEAFAPNFNRQKYCPSCSKKVHRRQKNESARKRKAENA